MSTPNFSVEDANKLFEYKNGNLFWRVDRGSKKCKGMMVGFKNDKGYYKLRVRKFGGPMLLHRMIYFMHHGVLPEFLDHINGDKSDNRIENLRPATKSQNNSNRFLQKNNTTGYKNVYWSKRLNKWFVAINHQRKKKYFGLFEKLDDALLVANQARQMLHGSFANNGVNK